MGSEDGLVAAAARYTQRLFGSRVAKPDDAWQTAAWELWRDTPEVRFGGTWVGNMMGMARLFAGKRMPDGSVVPLPPEHPASIKVAEMAGGPSGQSQMLTEHGPNLFTVGEDWTIIEQTDEGERWHILSTLEARRQGSALQVELDGRTSKIPLPGDDFTTLDPDAPLAIRTWQPFPGRQIEADSSVRSSFALLEELRLLNAAVAAVAKSRLTGRGIVFMPQGTSFPSTQGAPQSDDLIGKLIEIAGTAYGQPDSAAATVPIFLEVPRDATTQPEHMEFDSSFDTLAVTLREEAIRRFAAGCDFPAEIMLGAGDASHWGVWALDESAIRLAIIPRLRLVCQGYTSQWLRPTLEVMGADDAAECLVWYDATDLRPRTNRSQTAIELFGLGQINGDALRRETNFDDADKPTKEQEDRAILIGIVRDAPSTAPIILPLLGIDVPGLAEAIAVAPAIGGGGDVPAPTVLPIGEDPGPPRVSEGLMAAADALVTRAMDLAGQRTRNGVPRSRRGALEQIEASAVHISEPVTEDDILQHKLLAKAWDHAPEIAARYGVDPSDLVACLDRYTRDCLVNGVEHAWEQIPAVLAPLVPVVEIISCAEAS